MLTNLQPTLHSVYDVLNFVCTNTYIEPGAIIGDGDRKRAISSIGAVPMIWDNFSIFRTNCAIACGTRAYMLRGFLRMSRGGNDVRNPRNV